MRRALRLCFCLLLVIALDGCEVFTFLWDGIIGKGYYQVTRSSVAAQDSNLSTAAIPLSGLTTSAVIVYKTAAPNDYYGKLSFTSISDSSLTIIFTTYASDGTTLVSSNSTTISVGSDCDLESASGASVSTGTSTSDFTFSAGQILTPTNGTFFLYST